MLAFAARLGGQISAAGRSFQCGADDELWLSL